MLRRRHYPGASLSIADILGSLYHSDFDLQDGASAYTTATGIASIANRGLSTTALTQATGSRQPPIQTWGNAPSGALLRCARFDGSADSLMAVISPNLPTGTRTYLWLVAGGSASVPANKYLVSVQDSSYGNGLAITSVTATADRFSGSRGNPTSDIVNTTIPISASKHVAEVGEPVGAVACVVIDGAAFNGASEKVPVAALTHVVVGSAWYPSAVYAPASYDFGQLVIASGIPTAAQILAVRTHLKQKWGTL